jgi:hypothetical protein
MATLRALHIGDLHFWTFPLNPLAYLGKRFLGVGNLALRRARLFHKDLAPTLVARAAELAPDRMLLSGDFSTTALPAEFAMAHDALSPLVARGDGRALAVPGNHDRYDRRSIRARTMEATLGGLVPGGTFPWLVELGDGVVAAGIDPTVSNGMGSHGRVPRAQVEELARRLAALPSAPSELWMVCHFPAEDPPGVLKHDRGIQLFDADILVDFLVSTGLPVRFLHGHHHYRWVYRSKATPTITYLNAGAPLMARPGPKPDLGFHELVRDGGETFLRMHTWDAATGAWDASSIPWPGPGGYVDLQKPAAELREPDRR